MSSRGPACEPLGVRVAAFSELSFNRSDRYGLLFIGVTCNCVRLGGEIRGSAHARASSFIGEIVRSVGL
jgi:hypothetical protein